MLVCVLDAEIVRQLRLNRFKVQQNNPDNSVITRLTTFDSTASEAEIEVFEELRMFSTNKNEQN